MPGTYNDGESDANGKCPSDLEERSKNAHANLPGHGVGRGQSERRDRGDSGEDVEEHTGGLGHHLAQDARSLVLKVEFALRHRLGRYHVSGDVTLKGIRDTNFNVIGLHSGHVVTAIGLGHYGWPLANRRSPGIERREHRSISKQRRGRKLLGYGQQKSGVGRRV